jgi:shikimate kinase/3-dehydroquinate synthase
MRHNKEFKNIVLIGFSATGKSIVGKKVAEYLRWDFIDTDDEIVKTSGKTISDIFKQDGENAFRQLERKAIEQTCAKENVVISTGGGAILNPENVKILQKTCVIICLEAKVETIYQRLQNNALYSSNPVVRPLLAGEKPLERIRELKNYRQPYYSIADWTVHTDSLTIEEVSWEVVRGWRFIHRSNTNTTQANKANVACTVETASKIYPVFVGWSLLHKLGEKMRDAGLSGKAVIISDESVSSIYGEQTKKIIEKAGFEVSYFTVPPGEVSKNVSKAIGIYDFLIEHRIERNDVLIALGGGMIGDLAGFVAATYLRGIPYVQVPTSLIAMVDASIGGKVAVDHPRGKNLIGAFYQPSFVLADIQTLSSLPQRELTSGWAEVVKYGLILDAEFFKVLEDNVDNLVRLTPDITAKVIGKCVCLKSGVVNEDEKDTGGRIILNYGHTVAHGLESTTKYGIFLHGEAVSIGMMAAAKLSQRLGSITSDTVQRQQVLLEKFHLPISCSGIAINDVLTAMNWDKKVRNKAIQWVLLERIGKTDVRNDILQDYVLDVLKEVIKA